MAGHRRDEEDFRIVLAARAAKAEKLAERRPQDALLLDRNELAAGLDGVDAVVGPGVGETREGDELVVCRHAPPRRGEGVRRPGLKDSMRGVGGPAYAVMDVGHPLVGVIEHYIRPASQPQGSKRCASEGYGGRLWHVAC